MADGSDNELDEGYLEWLIRTFKMQEMGDHQRIVMECAFYAGAARAMLIAVGQKDGRSGVDTVRTAIEDHLKRMRPHR